MESLFQQIVSNQVLVVPIFAWFIAQFLKFIISSIKRGKIDFKMFVAVGGFPSSHTAIVSALATYIGLSFGFNSALFAISVIFASVVISDARGIRQAAGKQAEVLNKIIEDLYQKKGLKMERLRELLGHTSMEVFFGAILGILVAFFFSIKI